MHSRMRTLKYKSNTPNSSGHYYACLAKKPSAVVLDYKEAYRTKDARLKEIELTELSTAYTGNVLHAITHQERMANYMFLESALMKKLNLENDNVDPEAVDETSESYTNTMKTYREVLMEEMDAFDCAFMPLSSSDTFKHNCFHTGCRAFDGKDCGFKGRTLVKGQKSTALMEFLATRYTKQKGQLVADPFMGSGEFAYFLFVEVCS